MNAEVELAELTLQKRALEVRVKKIQESIDGCAAGVLAEWQATGVTRQTVKTAEGPVTLYLSNQVWAKAEFPDLEKAENEFPGLMTLNWMKASSLLRELLATEDKEALAQLAACGISADERTRINVRRG